MYIYIMDIKTYNQHKLDNPQLSFTLLESKLIPYEVTWNKEYGIYNIFRRDFYLKCNNKKCYVDYFIKQINVERHKLTPCKNGYSFRIKNEFLQDFIN